jgi:hypothetical protein
MLWGRIKSEDKEKEGFLAEDGEERKGFTQMIAEKGADERRFFD